jgi:hypothetical protein
MLRIDHRRQVDPRVSLKAVALTGLKRKLPTNNIDMVLPIDNTGRLTFLYH